MTTKTNHPHQISLLKISTLTITMMLSCLSSAQSVGGGASHRVKSGDRIDQSCSTEEARRISETTEARTLEKVRADAKVEGRSFGIAIGFDQENCSSKAIERARYYSGRAVESCVQQTTYFRDCQVTDIRLTQVEQIQPVTALGGYEETHSNESVCKSEAQSRATANAISECQNKYGTTCEILSVSEAAYRVERKRRYGGLFGPKEDVHICSASALSRVSGPFRLQCKAEAVAKVRF